MYRVNSISVLKPSMFQPFGFKKPEQGLYMLTSSQRGEYVWGDVYERAHGDKKQKLLEHHPEIEWLSKI